MRVESMKNVLCVAVSGLLGSDDVDQGDKLIGRWRQVNAGEVGKLTAHIYKIEEGYCVGVVIPLADQQPVVVNKAGQFKDNLLKVADLESVRLEPATGRLMIGPNEFEPLK